MPTNISDSSDANDINTINSFKKGYNPFFEKISDLATSAR